MTAHQLAASMPRLFIAINNEKTRNSVNGNIARILVARAVTSYGARMAEAFRFEVGIESRRSKLLIG